MNGNDRCPKCGEVIILVNVGEDGKDWDLDPLDYDEGEDAEVWLCYGISCGWNQEATPEEVMEEHIRTIEWLSKVLAR